MKRSRFERARTGDLQMFAMSLLTLRVNTVNVVILRIGSNLMVEGAKLLRIRRGLRETLRMRWSTMYEMDQVVQVRRSVKSW